MQSYVCSGRVPYLTTRFGVELVNNPYILDDANGYVLDTLLEGRLMTSQEMFNRLEPSREQKEGRPAHTWRRQIEAEVNRSDKSWVT
ncbi:hypothetical protein CVS40_6690 [Lucilia cuprina]|nr:hypothetical protein CVS40_6690 [Lucilia cuprina]